MSALYCVFLYVVNIIYCVSVSSAFYACIKMVSYTDDIIHAHLTTKCFIMAIRMMSLLLLLLLNLLLWTIMHNIIKIANSNNPRYDLEAKMS